MSAADITVMSVWQTVTTQLTLPILLRYTTIINISIHQNINNIIIISIITDTDYAVTTKTNTNNNTKDNVYGAVTKTLPLREFTQLI